MKLSFDTVFYCAMIVSILKDFPFLPDMTAKVIFGTPVMSKYCASQYSLCAGDTTTGTFGISDDNIDFVNVPGVLTYMYVELKIAIFRKSMAYRRKRMSFNELTVWEGDRTIIN